MTKPVNLLQRLGRPVCAAAALGLLLSACNPAQTVEITPTPVATSSRPRQPVYQVARGDVVKIISFLGRVQAIEDELLSFQVAGRVSQVAVRDGTPVKQGDVLAELDVTDLHNQIESAQIELDTSQAILSKTLSTITETVQLARIDLNQAQLRLAQAQARDYDALIASANAEVARADRLVADANSGLTSARNTPADKDQIAGFERILLDAQLSLSRARASVQQLLQDQKAHTFDVAILSKEVERQRMIASRTAESVDPNLQRTVEVNRLTLERLKAQLGRAQIIAPFDGEISSIKLTIGADVRAFDPVIVIAKPGGLEFASDVEQLRMNDLSVGMTVTISLDSVLSKATIGHIRRLPPLTSSAAGSVNPDRTLRVALDDPNVVLTDGQLAEIKVITARRNNVLWLPPQAIRNFQGRRFVVVRDSEGERRADVKVGVDGEDRTEILNGVLENQTVLAP